MYQFVLGSGLQPPFMLCIAHPRRSLPLQTSGEENIQQFRDILIHVNQVVDHHYDLMLLQDFLDPIVSV